MAEANFLIPDNSNGNIPVGALPYLNGGNNGLFGGNGWGGGILGFFLGLLCGNGGFGNFGFGGNGGNTVDLLMQAINNNGYRNQMRDSRGRYSGRDWDRDERMMRRDGDWDDDMPRGRYGY